MTTPGFPSPDAPAPDAAPPAGEPRFWAAFVAALAEPWALFARARGLGGIGAPLSFAATIGFFLAAWTLLASVLIIGFALLRGGGSSSGAFGFMAPFWAAAGLLIGPLRWGLAALLGGVLVHVVAGLSGGRGTFGQSLRIAAYALAPVAFLSVTASVLGYVPILRGAVFVKPLVALGWWAYVVALGVEVLHGGRRRLALALAVVSAVVLLTVAAGAVSSAPIAPGSITSRLLRN